MFSLYVFMFEADLINHRIICSQYLENAMMVLLYCYGEYLLVASLSIKALFELTKFI